MMKGSLKICWIIISLFTCNALRSQCDISNVQITYSPCGLENGQFFLMIDFDHQNTSQNFYVKTPYTTHIFPYSALPVNIGEIPGYCSGGFDVEIYDLLPGNVLNPDCFEIVPMNYQCCNGLQCGLEIVSVDWGCGNGNFDLFVNFKEFGCLQNSTYDVIVTKLDLNQNIVDVYNYGPFNYEAYFNDRMVTVPETPGCEYLYKIKVEDNTTGQFFEKEKNLYCCDCVIAEFAAEVDESSCGNGEVTINFDFTGYGFESNHYTISDGTNTWEFEENSPQEFVAPAYCNGGVTLTATLTADGCSTTFDLPEICCPCEINDIAISDPICDDTTFSFFVDLDIEGSCIYADWTAQANGNVYPLEPTGNEYLVDGVFSQDSLVSVHFCTDIPEFICQEMQVNNPCYSPPNPPDPCAITSFNVWQDTICNNGMAVIRFEYQANATFGNNGYYVTVDSSVFFFEESNEKKINYPSYCNNNVNITIYDAVDSTCLLSEILSELCCGCSVDSVMVTTSSCDSGIFNITLAFEGIMGSCQFGSWSVEVSDSLYQAVEVNGFWTVNGIISSDTSLTYEICSSFGECFTTFGINPCLDSNGITPAPCQLDSFNVFTLYDCSNGFVVNGFTFQGNNFGQEGYYVSDGLNSFYFEEGEPQEFSSFGSCNGSLGISIFDANDSLCTLTDTISPCCPCMIDSFAVTAVCDSNDLISIQLELFNVEGFCSLSGWTVTVNNISYPMYINADSVYTALNINSSDTILVMSFCTNTGQTYCLNTTKINPCLLPSGISCKISNAEIEFLESPAFHAKITLDHNEYCGNLFRVTVNDTDLGVFEEFEGIVNIPLSTEQLSEYSFKICNETGIVECIEKTEINPFFVNTLELEFNRISVINKNGYLEINNPGKVSFWLEWYDVLGRLMFKKWVKGEETTVEYKGHQATIEIGKISHSSFKKTFKMIGY